MKPDTPHKPPENETPAGKKKPIPERPLDPPTDHPAGADDDSVAGEEDPGSAADVLRRGVTADKQ